MPGQIHLIAEENTYDLDRGGGIFSHGIWCWWLRTNVFRLNIH